MEDEEIYLLSAQNQAGELLQHLDEALSADSPDEMREHVGRAMSPALSMHDNLEDAINAADDPDMADRIEDSMHQLGMAMDLADQALDGSDEDLEQAIIEMHHHVQQSASALGQVVGVAL